MENEELLDAHITGEHPEEEMYSNAQVLEAYRITHRHIAHLSKLYLFLIGAGVLATVMIGLWIMVQYAENNHISFNVYFSEWRFLLLLGITFALGIAISLWFWKQFDRYQKAMGEYLQLPNSANFAFLQAKRERWWYLVQMAYMVWLLMYILQLFLPTEGGQVAEI